MVEHNAHKTPCFRGPTFPTNNVGTGLARLCWRTQTGCFEPPRGVCPSTREIQTILCECQRGPVSVWGAVSLEIAPSKSAFYLQNPEGLCLVTWYHEHWDDILGCGEMMLPSLEIMSIHFLTSLKRHNKLLMFAEVNADSWLEFSTKGSSVAQLMLMGRREKTSWGGEREMDCPCIGYREALSRTELGLHWQLAYN